MINLHDISQAGIMIFGCSAIYLVGRVDKWKKYGYLAGLLSQPFWFYTAYEINGFGMYVLCTWYSFAWAQGFYNYWIRRE